MKTGIGSYAVQIDDLKVGAVVALNAFGNIYDWKNGSQIAGVLTEDKKALRSEDRKFEEKTQKIENRFVENTTLAVIITNAAFEKSSLCKIAGMGHDGYARAIRPVHTSLDGDSIYAVSVGNVSADQDVVGSLAAEVIGEAIIRAVNNAEGAFGLTAKRDLV